MQSFITSIGTAVPQYRIEQQQAAKWMTEALQLNTREQKIIDSLYGATGIENRYTVLPDYLSTPANFTFFSATKDMEPFPTVAQRMKVYRQVALPLSLDAIKDCLKEKETVIKEITHIITVSCTGMYAPGLDIELIEHLDLPSHTQRTAIHFMGCYAAFNGLKTADYICRANPEAKVLVVCVELCTLHFQKRRERDSFLSNALFGDGAAAVLVEGKAGSGVSFAMESFHCELEPNGKNDMAWHIGDNGFEMTLSSYVPQFIKGGIKELSERLLKKMGLNLANIAHFAIHPGGRRILEVCGEELGLDMDALCQSYTVLKNYGNMSSPTVLFVLNNIKKNLTTANNNEHVLSFAFGPGLTLESMLLRVGGG